MEINHKIELGNCYGVSIYMDEIDSSNNLFKYLITPLLNQEKQVNRGAHISVVGEEYTVSVFYNQLGWVDVGYNYLKLVLCSMKSDCTITHANIEERKKNNLWSLRY